MEFDDADNLCDDCGAAREPGLACCRYCGKAFIASPESRAVPCWNCKRYNDWGNEACGGCKASLLVKCLACQADSPHHLKACQTCGVPF